MQIFPLIANHLDIHPEPAAIILIFFIYAFLGNILECFVLTWEQRRPVVNRGFVRHLPFCIIYGFGALLGYALLQPVAHNFILLFLVGAVAATILEYCVARLQLRFFGDFWWDYSKKRFNYQGILCLESTLGWGIVAIVVLRFLHGALARLLHGIPSPLTRALAIGLVAAYLVDFAFSARAAYLSRLDAVPEGDFIPEEDSL